MLKKILKILFSLVLLYGILGFIVLPYMLKPELIKIIQSQTNTKVKLQNIYFNPFIFKIKLNNLELLDMQKKHLISFDFLMLDVEPHSLIKSAIHVKTLLLSEPKISVIYTKDKIINLSKIIKKTKEEKPKKENCGL